MPTNEIVHALADQDSRVRYYACEALYNIAKVAREGFMIFFHDVFDALFRLCADSEANVQNAAQFLDNLVKVSLRLDPLYTIRSCVMSSHSG